MIPSDFAAHLVKSAVKQSKDPFKLLGVSSQDKMTFYLLKWVFNAIKLDSDPSDKQLQGKPYVTKSELVK